MITSHVSDVTTLFYDKKKKRVQNAVRLLVPSETTRRFGQTKEGYSQVGFFAKTGGEGATDMNQEQESKLDKLLVYVQLLRHDVWELKGKLGLLSDDQAVISVPSSQGDDE